MSCHSPSLQFTINAGTPVLPIPFPILLWHDDYACHNFFHFLVDALPVLITGLRALNGSLPLVHAMAGKKQVRGRVGRGGQVMSGKMREGEGRGDEVRGGKVRKREGK